jgi:hypothetical protein
MGKQKKNEELDNTQWGVSSMLRSHCTYTKK